MFGLGSLSLQSARCAAAHHSAVPRQPLACLLPLPRLPRAWLCWPCQPHCTRPDASAPTTGARAGDPQSNACSNTCLVTGSRPPHPPPQSLSRQQQSDCLPCGAHTGRLQPLPNLQPAFKNSLEPHPSAAVPRRTVRACGSHAHPGPGPTDPPPPSHPPPALPRPTGDDGRGWPGLHVPGGCASRAHRPPQTHTHTRPRPA